jgi:hypothetical protein
VFAITGPIYRRLPPLSRPLPSLRRTLMKRYGHFVVGNPVAFHALKPPAMERTFL